MKNIMVYPTQPNSASLEPYNQGHKIASWPSAASSRIAVLRGGAFEIGEDFVIVCSPRQALDVGCHMSRGADRALAVKHLSEAIESEKEARSLEGVATVRSTGEVLYSAWLTSDATAKKIMADIGVKGTVIIDVRFLRWHVIGPLLAALERCMGERDVLIVCYQNFVADVLFGLQRGQAFSVSNNEGRLFRHWETGALAHAPNRLRSERVMARQKTFEKLFAKLLYGSVPDTPYRARERFLDIAKTLPKSQVPIDPGPWASPLVSAIAAPNAVRAVSGDLRGGAIRGLDCEPGGGWCVTHMTRASFRIIDLRGRNVLALALYSPGGPDHPRRGIIVEVHAVSAASQSENTIWLGPEPSWHLLLLPLLTDVTHEIVDLTIRATFAGGAKGSQDPRPLTVKLDEISVLPQAIADMVLRGAGQARVNGLYVHGAGESKAGSIDVAFIEQHNARLSAGIDCMDQIIGFVGGNRIAACERVIAQERLDVVKSTTALSSPMAHYLNRLISPYTTEAQLVPAWEAEVDGATWRAVGFNFAEGNLLWTCRDVAYLIADLPTSEEGGEIQFTISVHASLIPFNDESRIEIWAQGRKVFASPLRIGSCSSILPSQNQFVVRIVHQAAYPSGEERGNDLRTLGVALSFPKLVRLSQKTNVQHQEIAS